MASSVLSLSLSRSVATTLHRQRLLDTESGLRGTGIVPRAEIRALRTKNVHTPKLGSIFVSTRDSRSSSELVRLRGALRYATPIRANADVTSTVKTAKRLPQTLDRDYEALHFTSYANWIIPGHVMLGRYPYVEPTRCKTTEQGDAQIQHIIESMSRDAPITFVCLQDELPSQGDNWTSVLHNEGMFKPYFDAVLATCARLDPSWTHAPVPEFLHFRIVDLSVR
eukprot:CAMPEP_0118923636 /NCGR_PEP_ID=MMETSP1169-20130426/2086_1 /TAXON_ID=36882 /ORGANISM="Pyramimonas obovata, Strain CCMP722" /LENGTH=223 /DNA_ID=CAMNT_0006864651 /DNA_START=162 /DNA_END=829 /DNA_ORIENTATION=-